MTRTDFYILSQTGQAARFGFVCRLVDKAYRQGHTIYIQVDDQTMADQLDTHLWQWQSDRFIPHDCITAEAESRPYPAIAIGHQTCPEAYHDLLVNLSQEIPPTFSRFLRVAEIATQDADIITPVRTHFRYYRERGYPTHTHNL